jgi:transcription elongation factor Elf1
MENIMEPGRIETINRCPRCRAPASVLETLTLQDDSVNQFGRRELLFIAESNQIIKWNPAEKLYHCGNCGLKYSFKDHIMERDPTA